MGRGCYRPRSLRNRPETRIAGSEVDSIYSFDQQIHGQRNGHGLLSATNHQLDASRAIELVCPTLKTVA